MGRLRPRKTRDKNTNRHVREIYGLVANYGYKGTITEGLTLDIWQITEYNEVNTTTGG